MSDATRAALLASIPGVTLKDACERFGVTKSAIARARRELGRVRLQPCPGDLVIAALSENGRLTSGPLADDLSAIASWVDYVNHDGCDAAEVGRVLESLVARGVLAIADRTWTLLREWPSLE